MTSVDEGGGRPLRRVDLRERDVVEAIETGDRMFRRSCDLVDASACLPLLERHLVAPTGRPRILSWRSWAVLMLLAAEHTRKLILTDTVRVAAGLTDDQRRDLDLAGIEVVYHHVEGNLTDLVAAFQEDVDIDTGEITGPRIPVALDEVASNMAVTGIPDEFRGWASTVALDSTDVECWARRRSRGAQPDIDPESLPDEPNGQVKGKSRGGKPGIRSYDKGFPRLGHDGRLQHSVDPDARDGYRSGKNTSRKEVFLGFDAHTVCMARIDGVAYQVPALICSFTLAPAGSNKAVAGLRALDNATDFTGPISRVLADRGYTYLSAKSWAGPLADRSITQTLDLHTHQYGVRPGPIPDTLFVDGGLFVIALPQHLRSLPPMGPELRQDPTIHDRYQQRAPYSFTPMGGIDPKTRKQRVRGPALTGQLRCPNHKPSMRRDPAIIPTTSCPPTGCSCAKTVTLTEEHHLRERQPRQFGTREWARDYHRRNQVESANADLKTHHLNLRRGVVRIRGLAKHALLLGFLLCVSNRLRAKAHIKHHDGPPKGLAGRRVNSSRRAPGAESPGPPPTPPPRPPPSPPPTKPGPGEGGVKDSPPKSTPAPDAPTTTNSLWLPLIDPT